jgi:GxxExxY protein
MENTNLKHSELTEVIIGTFYEVYNELGHGFLESVYENALAMALREKGLRVEQQLATTVFFRQRHVGYFYADLVVEGLVILELKAAKAMEPAHFAQLMNYLKATQLEVGLVLNFGPKPEFKRLAFDNDRKEAARNTRSILSNLFEPEI